MFIPNQDADPSIYDKMLIYNREQELARQEREKREQEWQKELESSMNQSDPTGHGETIEFIMKNEFLDNSPPPIEIYITLSLSTKRCITDLGGLVEGV